MMGVEPLEDTLPLPQIVRTMKSITVPSDGRSCTVDDNRSSSNVDGSSQPSLPTREQEASVRSSGASDEICERSTRDCVWEEVTYLLGSLERIKSSLKDGTDWDPGEIDWINERYTLCMHQAMHYVLCLNLSEILSTVSFPGEKLTYLQVAERVIHGCSRRELYQALKDIGISPGAQVYYKDGSECPVEIAEQILLSMIGDGEYAFAGDLPRKLSLTPNSGSYKDLKAKLKAKGRVWKSKKISGKVIQVIALSAGVRK